MSQVQITDLPQALPLTGTESVPIVQNGVTVRTTTNAISGAGALNYPFLTVGSTAGLTDARYLATGTGLSLVDGGAGSTLQINMTGAALSLNSAGTGIIVKTGANTVTGRSLAVGAGLSIANDDGVSGDPTISLGSFLSNFVSLTGTGMLAIQSGTVGKVNILGTANQIGVTNGDGASNITLALSSNPIIPGTAAMRVPVGTTGQQPAGSPGDFRYNTTTETFDGYAAGQWRQFSLTGGVTTFSAGSTGFTPSTPTAGVVTLGGILNPASGGTGVNNNTYTITLGGSVVTAGAFTTSGANPLTLTTTGSTNVTLPTAGTLATLAGAETLTNKTMSGTLNTFSNIGNSSLTNSSVTYNGVSVALGASGTITAVNPYALTIGTGLSGTSYDGASATTIAIANTGVVAASYGSSSKTLTATVNAQGQLTALADTNIAISYTQVSGLGTAANLNAGVANGVATLDGGGQVPLSQLPTAIQGALSYQGTWNASTNTPTLTSSVGTKGYFYVVDVAGSTNLNGITDWKVGDWAVFNGSIWQKIDNTDAVTSVNGYTGTVVLGYADVGAPSTTGTNATGTWGISITGNAATVTNGVYTTGSYADPTWITSLAASKLTGTVAVANGGTNLSSYSVGDMLYASGATTLSKLGIGTNTYIMTSSGSAPQWTDPTGITVGTATNAVNTGITAVTTNATHYLTFVSATTGNLPQLVNSSITCNPSTGQMTGGIAGGSF